MAERSASSREQQHPKPRVPEGGTRRVLIEAPSPTVDGGRYPAKRIVGEPVLVACDLVSDGHDAIAGRVLYRRTGEAAWQSAPLAPIGNDRFGATFIPDRIGRWEFTFEAFVDPYTTWRLGTEKKLAAGQDIAVELAIGARLLRDGAARGQAALKGTTTLARSGDGNDVPIGAAVTALEHAAAAVVANGRGLADRFGAASSATIIAAMRALPDLTHATRDPRPYAIVVDPPLARFSAWYELFPRSCGSDGKHGTFRDVVARLDYVASMGFDVLYLPPIHPIGKAFRKGPNNTLTATEIDPGSPWAIGGEGGGHKSTHRELGTVDDFRNLVDRARDKNIAVAMDIAFQVSPDHPYVKEHPDWFIQRPDGTIQYAENPPKKYQDVYPFDFECKDWEGLWQELCDVFLFWCDVGVRVFRVDNPHTKALRFWEWCIGEVKARYPDALFLAEAFTRPKLMYALAKGGFTQSYTYFTWRNTKQEFEEYLRELTKPPVSEFYRPNFWPNTPDILPEHLQHGGRPMFLLRLVLAATLSSNYGMYGPPFELMEHVARQGAEEYVDNEKFQLRTWDLSDPRSLRDVIATVNRARRENVALQQTNRLTFHRTDSDLVMAYSKAADDFGNVVLVVANMDPSHRHGAMVDLDVAALGIGHGESFQVHDLLSDARQHWSASRVYVELEPVMPASIFVVRRKVRTEHDFEYFL